MSEESRNQGIILASDGIPYFKDKGSNRSGYPCGARLANPPEQIGKSLGLTHLLCLIFFFFQTKSLIVYGKRTARKRRKTYRQEKSRNKQSERKREEGERRGKQEESRKEMIAPAVRWH